MMKKPALPKPTAAYMAAKRAECRASPCDECPPNLVDDDKAKAKEEMREQAPFWMSQATLSYTVPDSGIDQGNPSGPEPPHQKHNDVVFDESLEHVNTMNGGGLIRGAAGKYLAMGSFFDNPENKPVPGATSTVSPNLMGRYFLVKAEKDYSIPNPESCVSPPDIMGATFFAPAGSFILAFSGTMISSDQLAQDGILGGFPKPCYLLDEYQTYEKMLEVHQKMFDGVHATMCNNPMKGVTTALEDAGFIQGGSSDKEITVVGHSLGGAQAQLAAVQIAKVYNAKVRVITFESILAFTPEGAQKVVDDFIVGPDGVPDVSGKAEPTIKFPAEAGKITAQRWIEDDSPLTAAPLLYGAGFAPVCCPLPFLCPCNFFSPSYWKNKLELVGCWPFNQNLGKGYLSKALVTSVSLKVRAPCGCCQKKSKVGPYPNDAFEFFISEKRSYVSKAARRLGCVGNFPCEAARAGTDHQQHWLLWELYKGAYQNNFRTNGNTVSQYVPKVQKVTP